MLHLLHDATLQAYEIAGKNETDDLASSILQGLVAKAHALERGVEVRGRASLCQNLGSGLRVQFARLEAQHELFFLFRDVIEQFKRSERAVFTVDRHKAPRCHSLMRRENRGVIRGGIERG